MPENQEGNEDEKKEGDCQEETGVLLTGGAQEDLLIFLAAGAGVDDDNEAVPENGARASSANSNVAEFQHDG